MKNPKESLSELLARIEKAEISSICEKLRAIIAFADLFVPEMSSDTKEEFLIHVAGIRRQAQELLQECGTVLNGGQLTRVKSEFYDLKNYVEFLFALQAQEMVEQAHQAL